MRQEIRSPGGAVGASRSKDAPVFRRGSGVAVRSGTLVRRLGKCPLPVGPLPRMWGSSLEDDLFCSVRLRWCLGESAPVAHLLGQLLIGGELVAVHSQYRDDPASRGCQPDSLGLQEFLGAHEA